MNIRTNIKTLVCAAFCLNAAAIDAARAGEQCDVPVAEWQPRETLSAKLQAEGWRVESIKSSDGCYEARAFDKDGVPVEAQFNPKTLELVGAVAHATHG